MLQLQGALPTWMTWAFCYSGPLASPLCFTMCEWEGLATSCLILEPYLGAVPNL